MMTNLPVVTDSLTLYLAEIGKFPRLSAEEEHRYAVKFFEEKDLEAAHALITSNLRFVVKVASEYRQYGFKMLDLIQEGNVGLMMAVRKFNPYKGVRLISYAVWWIRAYIQNYLVSAWSQIKIGTTQAQRKLFYKLSEAKKAIRRLTGGEDDIAATADMLHVTDREIVEMEQRLKGDVSLDAEVPDSDGLTALETLADERMNQEELLAEYQQEAHIKQQISKAVEGLGDRERFVIMHRVACDEPMTLQEIAEHFCISRERVRQIEERALAKMRQALMPLSPIDI